jgi:hypothetical protein
MCYGCLEIFELDLGRWENLLHQRLEGWTFQTKETTGGKNTSVGYV